MSFALKVIGTFIVGILVHGFLTKFMPELGSTAIAIATVAVGMSGGALMAR